MDRRSFVNLLGGVGVTFGAPAGIAGADHHGRGGEADVPPDVHTVEVSSWDDTTLVADLYVPGERKGRYPAIVLVHGSGGDRTGPSAAADAAARNGYVALSPDLRGFGDSGGESTIDGPKEVADILVLVDALAADEFSVREADETVSAPVRPSSNGPLVGMRGASLGGVIQLLAAAASREWFESMDDLRISPFAEARSDLPDGLEEALPSVDPDTPMTYHGEVPDADALDAATPNLSLDSSPIDVIAPRIAWEDLSRAIAPNDVVKGSVLAFLNLDAVDMSEGLPSLWRQTATALTTGYNEFPESAEAFFARRTPDLSAIAAHDVPTLLLEEWDDVYIPPSHSVAAFEGIRGAVADPPPVAMTISPMDGRFFGGEPAHNWSYPWEEGPDDSVEAYLQTKTLAWFDRFLKDDDTLWDEHDFPTVSLYQRQFPDVPDRYEDESSPGWRDLEGFPPAGVSRTALDLSTARATDFTVLANSAVPTSLRGPMGFLYASPQADSPVGSMAFDFEATDDVDVATWPSIELAVSPLGDDAMVYAKFQLVESGEASGDVIDSQVMPYRIRDSIGERITIEYDHIPFQRYLEPGDRLRVVLSTTDNGHYNSREAAGVVVHHGTPGESLVTVEAESDGEVPLEGRPVPVG